MHVLWKRLRGIPRIEIGRGAFTIHGCISLITSGPAIQVCIVTPIIKY